MSFLQPKPATSQNVNNSLIKSTYGGAMSEGTGAMSNIASLLGVGGDPTTGYNNYLQLAGYAPAMKQLAQNITGQNAAAGMLQSGATDKALQDRGATLNNQFFNNYLQQLSGLSGLGLQAGGLVANTGQKSTGAQPSVLGSIAQAAGGLASIFAAPATGGASVAASDRRLKRDVELIRREADGLGVYLCRYAWSKTRRLMVMADEVARFRPWALGPKIAGYATVNYGKL